MIKNIKIPPNVMTRLGTRGFKTKIKSGSVTITAKNVDEYIVAVTTSGIGLINSPMIPVVSNKGT